MSNDTTRKCSIRCSALDLKVADVVVDTQATEESTFTVAAIEIRGVSARITTPQGETFTYGGLYRGLLVVERAVVAV